MKKLVYSVLAVYAVTSGSYVFAACLADSGICYENGQTTLSSPKISNLSAGLMSKTLAQINALTPSAAGEMVYCSNCVNSGVCISSGTGVGAYVSNSSPTVHCDVR